MANLKYDITSTERIGEGDRERIRIHFEWYNPAGTPIHEDSLKEAAALRQRADELEKSAYTVKDQYDVKPGTPDQVIHDFIGSKAGPLARTLGLEA